MLKDRELRILAEAAVDLGKPELTEQVARIRKARIARAEEHLREVIFRIQADRIAREAEISELRAQFKDDHDARQRELARIKAEVRSLIAEYRAENKAGREEWERQLAALWPSQE
mgnify:CR=1 FL=1